MPDLFTIVISAIVVVLAIGGIQRLARMMWRVVSSLVMFGALALVVLVLVGKVHTPWG